MSFYSSSFSFNHFFNSLFISSISSFYTVINLSFSFSNFYISALASFRSPLNYLFHVSFFFKISSNCNFEDAF